MAQGCCKRGRRLGKPFLADGFESPEERRQAIADEVQLYIQAKRGMQLPPDAVPEPQIPPALYWLLWVEKHGPVHAGGSLDQPWHFMQDLEAAALGRMRVDEIAQANADLKRRYKERHQ